MALLIIFLICPFVSFLFSCKNLKRPVNGLIFVLFSGLYGYCTSFTVQTADSFRVGWSFSNIYNQYFGDQISLFLQGDIADIYSSFIKSFVLLYTNNPKFLFLVFGLIFGVLSYFSMKLVIKERIGGNNKYFSIIMICFFSLFSFLDIQGVRFGTAFWLFFLSSCQYLIYKNTIYIVGILLTPFIHFSYFPLALFIVFISFISVKKRYDLMLYLFYFSFLFYFFVDMLSLQSVLQNLIPIKGGLMEYKVLAYSSEAENLLPTKSTSLYRAANGLFTRIFQYIMQFSALFIIRYISNNYDILKKNIVIEKMFPFCLMLFSISNIFHGVIWDGTGIRYIWVSWMFLLFLIYQIYNMNRNYTWIRIIQCLPFIFFYKLLYMAINSYRLTDGILWFMNLPYIIYDGIGFSIPYYF